MSSAGSPTVMSHHHARNLWAGGKDPWTAATWLPCWNPETREVLVFHAANDGSKDAVANLAQAYITNCEAHPDQINFDPLIELEADSYESKHGRRIYYPVFDTVDWIERPTAILRVMPPPVKMLELTATPAPTFGELPPAKSDQHQPIAAKAKPKKSAKPNNDLDDEIAF